MKIETCALGVRGVGKRVPFSPLIIHIITLGVQTVSQRAAHLGLTL